MKLLELFQTVWRDQIAYNKRVKERQERSPAEWMETYILGLMSECGQLLEAMRWKKHRLQSIDDFGPNVPEELADITKYVLSMWQLLGYTGPQMLEEVHRKNLLLSAIFTQEFDTILKEEVVIFDIDNVLADTQEALGKFFFEHKFDWNQLRSSIHLDLATSQPFDEYRELKNKWEQTGGYSQLEPMYDVEFLFSELRSTRNCSIVCYTARPVRTFKRIHQDTFNWLYRQKAPPDMLLFGREERIGFAAKLQRNGQRVVLVDDDPSMFLRCQNSRIPIVVPNRSYNKKQANFSGSTEDLVHVLSTMLEEQKNPEDADILA